MYTPQSFSVSDLEELHAFIRAHSFCTLVSGTEAGPVATHLPVMLDAAAGGCGTLVGHMARANPHWQCFASGEPTLAIFHGPHGYVSPTMYLSSPVLPTWNYAAVHVYGRSSLLDDPLRVRRVLDELVDREESTRAQPWDNVLPAEYRATVERRIVAFELAIDRIEGKYKLSQNRPPADQRSALEHLEAEGTSPELVAFWREKIERRESGD